MYKTKIDNLDLKQIADSGQCFRWKNTGENEYTVVAFTGHFGLSRMGMSLSWTVMRQTGTIYGKAIWIWIRIMRGLQSL